MSAMAGGYIRCMSAEFRFEATPLPGLLVVHRKVVHDDRGCFERIFCADAVRECFGSPSLAQVNFSRTNTCGAVRGMHFQYPPYAEVKLVSCIRGAVYDVAVDIRRDSPTFLRWFGIRLEQDEGVSLLIPEGFAHGFQAVTEYSEILYCNSKSYAPSAEGGLDALDPRLGIVWPSEITQRSERDARHPRVDDEFKGLLISSP